MRKAHCFVTPSAIVPSPFAKVAHSSVLYSTHLCAAVLYLLPPIAGAALLLKFARSGALFAALCLPATIAHELLHFVVGHLVWARPTRLSIFPHRSPNGVYVYGMVAFENVRWWNAAPAALAPLLSLPIAAASALWRTRTLATLEASDIAIWFGLAQLLVGAWPSPTDLRLAGRSWPLLAIAGISASAYFALH